MQDFRITNTNHKNLDGLRATGILMVFIAHFFGTFIPSAALWTSIDLLFALSGLLITGILIETKSDSKYFKKFYMRRILRIFPLYYLLIGIFYLYTRVSAHPENFLYFKNNIGWFLTYTQNWLFIRDGQPLAGHLNHTWSLAIDEQIYLVWPLLIWLCKTEKQLIRLCIGTILFSLIYRLCYNYYLVSHPSPHEYPYFHNTFCRMDSFAAGSLMYCFLKFKKLQLTDIKVFFVAGLSALLFIACGIADQSFNKTGLFMRNFGCTLAGIHFTTWIYIAVKNRFRISNAFLSHPFMIYTGKISYSLYVFHFFILHLLISRIQEFFVHHFNYNSELLASAICLIISFITAMISYRYLELPIIALKKKFSYSDKPPAV